MPFSAGQEKRQGRHIDSQPDPLLISLGINEEPSFIHLSGGQEGSE